MRIVSVDLGGTHVRFAVATIEQGRIVSLSKVRKLETASFATLKTAWDHFAAAEGSALPRAAAIAVAAPMGGDVLKLTNNPWLIRPQSLAADLGVDALTLINDFAAVGHAIAHLGPADLRPLTGPDRPLPESGVISVIGPGTGLGVAQVVRRNGKAYVIATEGGHVDFAPVDAIEDTILTRLRTRYRRVSVERVISGPGLYNIYEVLSAIGNTPAAIHDDVTLWQAALAGSDPMAAAALDRFCLSLGSVCGNIALTQGAAAVVIAGGIGHRLAEVLPTSGFADRFAAKGRFESIMMSLPVKILTHPHVGLIGAAAAFAEEHNK